MHTSPFGVHFWVSYGFLFGVSNRNFFWWSLGVHFRVSSGVPFLGALWGSFQMFWWSASSSWALPESHQSHVHNHTSCIFKSLTLLDILRCSAVSKRLHASTLPAVEDNRQHKVQNLICKELHKLEEEEGGDVIIMQKLHQPGWNQYTQRLKVHNEYFAQLIRTGEEKCKNFLKLALAEKSNRYCCKTFCTR